MVHKSFFLFLTPPTRKMGHSESFGKAFLNDAYQLTIVVHQISNFDSLTRETKNLKGKSRIRWSKVSES